MCAPPPKHLPKPCKSIEFQRCSMEGGSGQQHDSGCDITTARAPRESARAPRESRVTSRQPPAVSRQPPAASRQLPAASHQPSDVRIKKHKQSIGSISVKLATTGKCCAHLVHTTEYRSTSNALVPFRSHSQQKENAAHIQNTLHNTESQATHWFHFVQTRNNSKMLRTPNAHCQRQKHKQFIVTISVGLAATAQCCAHLAHTAICRSTDTPLVPLWSELQQLDNAAHTYCTQQNTRAQTKHLIYSGQTRNSWKMLRTLPNTETQASHRLHFGQTHNNRKCCAHLTHTARDNSASNPMIPVQLNS